MQLLYNNLEQKSISEKIVGDCLRGLCTASDTKESISRRRRYERHIALEYCSWVEYNEDRVKVLIFDLDKDVPLSLDGVYAKVMEAVKIEPTWICMTDKGAHVAYVLENSLEYAWKKPIAIARKIKRAMTEKLGADTKGSHRLKGWWRNPLVHDYYLYDNSYSLSDFYSLLAPIIYDTKKNVQQQFKSALNARKREDASFFNYKVGTRNDVLWYVGMGETRNGQTNFEEVFRIVKSLQDDYKDVEPLPIEELEMITRSICKYNAEGTNRVEGKRKDTCKNRGAMKFKKISSDGFVEPIKHASIVKKRQRASAKKTNEGIDMATRLEHMEKVNRQREARNRSKIKAILQDWTVAPDIKKKNGKYKAVSIAKILDIDRRTVSKYLKEFDLV